MSKYTLQQRIRIVELYHENKRIILDLQRQFEKEFGFRPRTKIVNNIIAKFSKTGHVDHVCPVRTAANIRAVKKSIEDNPNMSYIERVKTLPCHMSETTMKRIEKEKDSFKDLEIDIQSQVSQSDSSQDPFYSEEDPFNNDYSPSKNSNDEPLSQWLLHLDGDYELERYELEALVKGLLCITNAKFIDDSTIYIKFDYWIRKTTVISKLETIEKYIKSYEFMPDKMSFNEIVLFNKLYKRMRRPGYLEV